MDEEKYRRMELRRENGTREVKPVVAPSYHRGPEYLVAHACFPCRKSFKMRGLDSESYHKCPDCKGIVYEMGRSFTSPKKTDVKQWKKVHRLYSAGFRFFGSGNHESENLPAKLAEVDDFLARNKEHYLRVAKIDESIEFDKREP